MVEYEYEYLLFEKWVEHLFRKICPMRHVTDFLKAVAQKAIKLNFLAILIFDKKAFRWKMYEVNHFGSARHND